VKCLDDKRYDVIDSVSDDGELRLLLLLSVLDAASAVVNAFFVVWVCRCCVMFTLHRVKAWESRVKSGRQGNASKRNLRQTSFRRSGTETPEPTVDGFAPNG
jgi:hypothetical protein